MYIKLEDFKMSSVVVPTFTDTNYGIVNVGRGDMTDQEWKLWRKVCETRELANLMSEYRKSKAPIAGMSAKIIAFLNEQGVSACLTGTLRQPTIQ